MSADILNDIPLDSLVEIIAAYGQFTILPPFHDCESGELSCEEPVFESVDILKLIEAPESFLETYYDKAAKEKRQIAVVGIQRRADEMVTKLLAQAMHIDLENEDGAYMELIGRDFANIVRNGGYKALQRMAVVMQSGGERKGEKGGEYTLNGRVLRELCRHIKTHRMLPTKKQLREAVCLSSSKVDAELFRRSLIQLGFSKLP